MNTEQWRPVLGFEGLYEVSDRGRVRSLITGKVVKPHVGNQRGHLRISLKQHAGPYKGLYVHRLVLEAFVEPFRKGMECRHLDGDPTNNRLENLRWGTQSENNLDRVKHGTHHHTRRTHCPKGHLLDGVWHRSDGTIRQRYCKTCESIRQKVRKAQKTHCAKGHPLEEAKVRADGSRYRTCKICAAETLQLGRGLMGKRTHCKYGHPLDGQYKRQRYCKTCKSEQQAKRRAKAKA
ncbi:NUMOD4 motif-containing HNH endonuclease [Mycobacterium sp. E1747]|uniref:NUMOD4 motif-containing HNH endonuclease n=1 Tax=Mycobacterium sp. E1747 TaxID=1834128 RepID=UPI0009EE7F4C